MFTMAMPARATLTTSYELVELFGDARHERGGLTIDCSKTLFLDPFGVALLAAMLAWRRHRERPTVFVPPVDLEAASFASEVGLNEFAAGQSGAQGTLAVRQLLALDAA